MADLEPGGRAPAPGRLRLVQTFVNTADLESRTDELSTPFGLQAWLLERDLVARGDPIDEEDLRRVLALREGLRTLALINNGVRVRGAPILRELNRVATEVGLNARFDLDGELELRPAGTGVAAFLARTLAIVATASLDGTWSRMKACRREVCRWMFFDHSRNRSGVWCAMAICGTRTKARRYQRRRRRPDR
jgi:predicted RNA-binding Zn ribbon-like protein